MAKINYDFKCLKCDIIFQDRVDYNDRDNLVDCINCDGQAKRGYYNVPNIRTAKLSRTYIDKLSVGGGRNSKEYDDLKSVAQLKVQLQETPPNSDDYTNIKKEIKQKGGD